MKIKNVKIPSNRTFGFFFGSVFIFLSLYFFFLGLKFWSFFCLAVGLSLLIIGLLVPNVLLPLNRLWLKFGLAIGHIVNPIILGFIFYGLILPIAIITRLFGRDELDLKLEPKKTYWKTRAESAERSGTFKDPF